MPSPDHSVHIITLSASVVNCRQRFLYSDAVPAAAAGRSPARVCGQLVAVRASACVHWASDLSIRLTASTDENLLQEHRIARIRFAPAAAAAAAATAAAAVAAAVPAPSVYYTNGKRLLSASRIHRTNARR
jgi:hypothetical protein